MRISGGSYSGSIIGSGQRFAAAFPPLHLGLPRLLRLSERELRDAVDRIEPDDIDLALRWRLIPLARRENETLYAAGHSSGLAHAQSRGLKVVAFADRHRLLALLQRRFQSRLKHGASRRLLDDAPVFSAARRLTRSQRWFIFIGLLLGVVSGVAIGAVAGMIVW